MRSHHFPQMLRVKAKGDRRCCAILEGPSKAEQAGKSEKRKKPTDSLRDEEMRIRRPSASAEGALYPPPPSTTPRQPKLPRQERGNQPR